MKDRKGNTLNVGDRVFVLPDRQNTVSGAGYIRKFSDVGPSRRMAARVDDGPREMKDLSESGGWSWSVWAEPNELELLDPATAPASK